MRKRTLRCLRRFYIVPGKSGAGAAALTQRLIAATLSAFDWLGARAGVGFHSLLATLLEIMLAILRYFLTIFAIFSPLTRVYAQGDFINQKLGQSDSIAFTGIYKASDQQSVHQLKALKAFSITTDDKIYLRYSCKERSLILRIKLIYDRAFLPSQTLNTKELQICRHDKETGKVAIVPPPSVPKNTDTYQIELSVKNDLGWRLVMTTDEFRISNGERAYKAGEKRPLIHNLMQPQSGDVFSRHGQITIKFTLNKPPEKDERIMIRLTKGWWRPWSIRRWSVQPQELMNRDGTYKKQVTIRRSLIEEGRRLVGSDDNYKIRIYSDKPGFFKWSKKLVESDTFAIEEEGNQQGDDSGSDTLKDTEGEFDTKSAITGEKDSSSDSSTSKGDDYSEDWDVVSNDGPKIATTPRRTASRQAGSKDPDDWNVGFDDMRRGVATDGRGDDPTEAHRSIRYYKSDGGDSNNEEESSPRRYNPRPQGFPAYTGAEYVRQNW